jgi:hypothetical protein
MVPGPDDTKAGTGAPFSVNSRQMKAGDQPRPAKEPRSPGRPVQPAWCSGSTGSRGTGSRLFDPATGSAARISDSATPASRPGSSAPQCTMAGNRPSQASTMTVTPAAVSATVASGLSGMCIRDLR